MSENRGPLVQHPDRRNVWVREDREEVFADRATNRTEPVWHHVTVWTSVAVVGWLTFFVAVAAWLSGGGTNWTHWTCRP